MKKISIFAIKLQEPPSYTAGPLRLYAANDEAFFLITFLSFYSKGERESYASFQHRPFQG